MKKDTVSKVFRTGVFLLCAAILFSGVSLIYERKTYSGAWNYMAKLQEFYELEEDSLDYICLGSSHMYCTVSPLEIWRETNIPGFVLATQQQPLRASYYYLKEAFKTQSPGLVILEGYMAAGSEDYEESVLYDAIDPLRFSLNKISMINALVEPEQRPQYYFNIIKYHSRWKYMTKEEAALAFVHERDIYKGFVPLHGEYQGANLIPDYNSVEAAAIAEHNLEAMNDILELTRENNAELVLMIAPYDGKNPEYTAIFKAEKEWAAENNVPVLDYALLLDELGIDPDCDYYDSGHLDVSGAAKISIDLAHFLREQGLTGNENADTALWQKDYDTYEGEYK